MENREEYMVERYGEAVKMATAARILDRDRATIGRMLDISNAVERSRDS